MATCFGPHLLALSSLKYMSLLQELTFSKHTKYVHLLDIHGSVHYNTIFIKMTNTMQLCRIIYYSIVVWLLYMFRAILSLVIRSILTVITASGFIHMFCRLLATTVAYDNTRMKPEAVITVKMLLMMVIISLETCRAAREQWNNKLSYTVASCWFFFIRIVLWCTEPWMSRSCTVFMMLYFHIRIWFSIGIFCDMGN